MTGTTIVLKCMIYSISNVKSACLILVKKGPHRCVQAGSCIDHFMIAFNTCESLSGYYCFAKWLWFELCSGFYFESRIFYFLQMASFNLQDSSYTTMQHLLSEIEKRILKMHKNWKAAHIFFRSSHCLQSNCVKLGNITGYDYMPIQLVLFYCEVKDGISVNFI